MLEIRNWRSRQDGARLHRISVEGTNRRMIVNDEELGKILQYAQRAVGGHNDHTESPADEHRRGLVQDR